MRPGSRFPLLRLAAVIGGAAFFVAAPARAVDPVADAAVTSLAQLTDPHRLAALPDATFCAQLGPALGWLHVARRRDVAPEAVIARAFALNGLSGERARLTRESLLRNLARADSWELFTHDASARALSYGQPAQIAAGIHRGHLAQAAMMLPEGLSEQDRREFACLVLRADDEMPYRPPNSPYRRQPGDLFAARKGAIPTTNRRTPAARVRSPKPVAAPVFPAYDAVPISYDEPLPVR